MHDRIKKKSTKQKELIWSLNLQIKKENYKRPGCEFSNENHFAI